MYTRLSMKEYYYFVIHKMQNDLGTKIITLDFRSTRLD